MKKEKKKKDKKKKSKKTDKKQKRKEEEKTVKSKKNVSKELNESDDLIVNVDDHLSNLPFSPPEVEIKEK